MENSIIMSRSILPVGQGAFYVESFYDENRKKFRVVYDCGSENKSVVKREINNSFCKGDIIDIVFISHIDNDHVCGLEYLLKNYEVRCVYLPYVKENNRIFIKLENYLSSSKKKKWSNEFLNGMIDRPVETIQSFSLIGEETKVVSVGEFGDNDQEYYRIKDQFPTGDSGEVISLLTDRWVYIPYNFNETKNKTLFREKLLEYTGVDVEKHPEFVLSRFFDKEFRKVLKKIYRGLEGGINTNSMTVYSGPYRNNHFIMEDAVQSYYHPYYHPYYYRHEWDKAGALYMGDFNANSHRFDELIADLEIKINRRINKCVALVQIPHHGSKHNYHESILRHCERDCIYFICAGQDNRYGHPHPYVMNELALHNCYTRIVTEIQRDALYFKIKSV